MAIATRIASSISGSISKVTNCTGYLAFGSFGMDCDRLAAGTVGNGPVMSVLAGILASGGLKNLHAMLTLIRSGIENKCIRELCRAPPRMLCDMLLRTLI